MKFTAIVLIFLGAAVTGSAQTNNELNFLSGQSDGRALRQMLPDWLKAKAFRMLDARKAETARITSSQQVFDRRRNLRERMTRGLGGFPERTPLNARVTGVLDRGDYRVEKVIFESQPGFHVTANLYVPARGQGPFPAILFPLGHEQPGAKAYPVWQHLLISFAKKGYVALAWDTLGQGERIQLWDEDFQASKVVRSTTEHTILGLQCLLAGDALAMYTIWDGIRALDYLLSRPEVDPKRIGVTGNSGGGTHTAYLAAMDDRIHVAASSCYLTSWRRLLETIGPQDAEQCIPPWIADGLDHADFVIGFAPKPFIILSAIRDFFSIAGARETFAESQRIYDSIGAGEKVAMVEADDGHGYSKPRREAAYGWFGRWLKGTADDSAEPELKIDMEEDLRATATGQVATSLNSETVFTLNQKRIDKNRQTGASIATVKRMLGYDPSRAPLNTKPYGKLERPGYRIEKLVYESEPGIVIPALAYVPDGEGRRPAVVVADGQGKSATNAVAEAIAKLGRVALSVDLRGLGETRTSDERGGSDWPRYFGDYSSAMTALLTAKPLVAMRAEDISRAVDLLAARADVDAAQISVYGRDSAAVAALYASALDSRIASAALERMLVSYDSVIRHRIHRGIWENAVHGALRHYDLPDLAKWMAPRKVQVIDAVDPLGDPVGMEKARALYTGATVTRRKPGDPPLIF